MSLVDDKISEQFPRVCCSWEVLNERRIDDALTLQKDEVCPRKRSLECMVSVETCVHLGVQNQSIPCIFELNLKNEGLKVKEIYIVSEARVIEIYGKCGEYLTTSHADFLDECEDMVVYVADFKFPQPTPECSLKFARMKVKDQMWLYGIYVCTEKETISQESSVNFNHVNTILKESSHQLTDKADKCKKFLQMYSSYYVSNTSQTLPNPHMLLKIFDSVCMNQCSSVGNQPKIVSKCLSDLFPSFTAFSKNKCSSVCEHNSSGNRGDGHDDDDDAVTAAASEIVSNREDECVQLIAEKLKHHLDQRFSELAVSLTCQVDRRLSELQEIQNKKLDEIVNLIQNIKQV